MYDTVGTLSKGDGMNFYQIDKNIRINMQMVCSLRIEKGANVGAKFECKDKEYLVVSLVNGERYMYIAGSLEAKNLTAALESLSYI